MILTFCLESSLLISEASSMPGVLYGTQIKSCLEPKISLQILYPFLAQDNTLT